MKRCSTRPWILIIPSVVCLLAMMASIASAHSIGRAGPAGADWSETYISSADGTQLHVDVFLPSDLASGERVPVILVVGPYQALTNYRSVSGPEDQGHRMHVFYTYLATDGRIFERGYAYVQVDLRGTGSSEGCYDIGGPGEHADVKAAVEWAASQPWSTGKVGMYGGSYDAWTQVMALATRPLGLAATVIMAPLIDPYTSVYTNGIPSGFAGALMPQLLPGAYAVTNFLPPAPFASPDEYASDLRGHVRNPTCATENIAGTANNDPTAPFWRVREIADRAASTEVPTLWMEGLNDRNAPPDQFLRVYSRLRGPKRAWIGQWEHRNPPNPANAEPVGRGGALGEVLAWYDFYLKGVGPDPSATPTYVQRHDGRWRAETQWPPADVEYFSLPIRQGAYRDAPGNSAEKYYPHSNDLPNGAGVFWQLPTGVGSWTFTQPLPYALHFAGEPEVTATVEATPGAHLVALLYDVDGEGVARFISRGAFLLPGSRQVTFRMWPQDWSFGAGHRLGLLLSGADDSWYGTPTSLTTVRILSGSVSLPFLRHARTKFIKGGPADAMRNHGPFVVNPRTIEEGTTEMQLPPRMEQP